MPTDEQINNASDLASIDTIISNCQRCSLHKTKTKDVPGIGNPKAKVLFIGEAPGKEEDKIGEPFVGAAGKFLTEMIEGLGWHRSDVYIANVLKHRPPENRDPIPSEIEACWPYLARQIDIIAPKLIVFLGRHAMQRFFPAFSISEVHGQAFRKPWNGRVQVFLALYHPAAALYNGGMRETLNADFKKIPKILAKIEAENIEEITNETKLNQSKLL
jgi:uracil-DNA glycosylase family 4